MKPVNRIFIHGLESSSQGNKGRYFKTHYPEMTVEDFEGPLDNRMEKLERLLADRDNLILIGSSFGGLMAAIYASRHPGSVNRLVLLAPALDLEDFAPHAEHKLDIPVTIYHARQDDIVPMMPVRTIAERIYANLNFNVVDDDHPLSATFPTLPWEALLAED